MLKFVCLVVVFRLKKKHNDIDGTPHLQQVFSGSAGCFFFQILNLGVSRQQKTNGSSLHLCKGVRPALKKPGFYIYVVLKDDKLKIWTFSMVDFGDFEDDAGFCWCWRWCWILMALKGHDKLYSFALSLSNGLFGVGILKLSRTPKKVWTNYQTPKVITMEHPPFLTDVFQEGDSKLFQRVRIFFVRTTPRVEK